MYILKAINSNAHSPLKYFETIEEVAYYLARHWHSIQSRGLYPYSLEYCQKTQTLRVFTDYTDEGVSKNTTYTYRLVYLSGVNCIVETI